MNMHALHSQVVMEEAWSIVGGNCPIKRVSGVDSDPNLLHWLVTFIITT